MFLCPSGARVSGSSSLAGWLCVLGCVRHMYIHCNCTQIWEYCVLIDMKIAAGTCTDRYGGSVYCIEGILD